MTRYWDDDTISDEIKEALCWIYKIDEYYSDKEENLFTFFIENGRLNYYYLSSPDKITTWFYSKEIEDNLFQRYIKVRRKEELCGPVQPPLSPLIKKIRTSYKRQREVYGITI